MTAATEFAATVGIDHESRLLSAWRGGRYNAGTTQEFAAMYHAVTLAIATEGRGTYEITSQIQHVVHEAKVERGLCNVFVHHTSASLIVCENAEPEVRRDLERFFARLVPDGDPSFRHDDEGPDDMPAHVRSILTSTTLALPIAGGRCDLGTWQGIYLYEHRAAPHRRKVTVSVLS